jgi:DNA invertase Pin-like site-specific DNA recombinase
MIKRTALYLRVSQDTQTTENQRRELIAVAERKRLKVGVGTVHRIKVKMAQAA